MCSARHIIYAVEFECKSAGDMSTPLFIDYFITKTIYTVKPDITKETVQTLFFVISRDSLYPGYIVYLIMVIYIVNSVISLLRHIIQVCSIFTNSNSPSVANCFAFRFTI